MIELVTRHTASSFQPNLSCRSRGLLCRHCNKWRLSSSTLELARGYGQEISISNFVVICSRCRTHHFFWSDPKFGVETFPYGACSIPRLPYGNQSNLSERVFFLLSLKWTKRKKNLLCQQGAFFILFLKTRRNSWKKSHVHLYLLLSRCWTPLPLSPEREACGLRWKPMVELLYILATAWDLVDSFCQFEVPHKLKVAWTMNILS